MPNYLVVRIVPQTPVDAETFANDYLAPLGGLTITAYQLDFATAGSQPAGPSIGSVAYNAITPAGFWTSDGASPPNYVSVLPPPYPNGTTTGLVQQVDFGFNSNLLTDVYTLESVATAVIEVNSVAPLENIQLAVQWASQTTPSFTSYYDLTLPSGNATDLSTWLGSSASDPWSTLTPNIYISLPVAPSAANPLTLQLPANGAPPAFDALLTAVNAVLAKDPGGPLAVAPTTAGPGATQLTVPAGTTGITPGMTVTGTGIAAGTVVTGFSGTTVTLNQEPSGAVSGAVNFAFNLAALSVAQCQNIANEILWSQEPALPTPPDPLEELYTTPPNDGSLLASGNSANQDEGDRQQFEAKLKTYYAATNANANQLATFIYALSAAVACEQLSLAATQVLLTIPANPGQPSNAPSSETEVILTGIGVGAGNLAPPAGFGVPAAYFYGLGNTLPSSMAAAQRYALATGDQLPHLLSQLTSAISIGAITDAETFVTTGAPAVNSAQAARRMAALGVPAGSATPLAPLGAITLQTSAMTAAGSGLTFASTAGLAQLMLVSGPSIAAGATISSAPTATTVTLSAPVLNSVPAGAAITFTPAFAGAAPVLAQLPALIQSWLAFPTSSQGYQPGDDTAIFWPGAAAAQPQAVLGLVLSALTQGYIIPAPFQTALGIEILAQLAPPTLATLAGYTAAQWTTLFKTNPTWLPPTPGGTTAGIAAFIQAVRQFFQVTEIGTISAIDLATSAQTLSGGSTLTFASVNNLAIGMSVSSLVMTVGTPGNPPQPAIPAGTIITAINSAATPPTVTIGNSAQSTIPVKATIPALTNIHFTPNVTAAAAGGGLPQLQMPSTDWLGACITAYNAANAGNPPYAFGNGIANAAALGTAAAVVFADPRAQAWLVGAITTIDALCGLVASAGYPVLANAAPSPNTGVLGFSLVEALYACGFRSASEIAALTAAEFQQAITGTVAYGAAGTAIYNKATSGNPTGGQAGGGTFKPINPDGSLTNCIPPPCLSPLGPVAYFSEMLKLSERSSCGDPFPKPPSSRSKSEEDKIEFHAELLWEKAGKPEGKEQRDAFYFQALSALQSQSAISVFPPPTLGSVLAQRRGPLGTLLATCANLETPLPLVDIVNENLEALGAAVIAAPGTQPAGVVYNTSADELAGFTLCVETPCPPNRDTCHDPATLFGALPEYSTPATPLPANAAVTPAVYNALEVDFSSCQLPYSQALDVNRSYVAWLRSCRFQEMRSFRRCITEFVLDPGLQPLGFWDYLWRYPVRIDIAIEYLGITPQEYRLLFNGQPAYPCVSDDQRQPDPLVANNAVAAGNGVAVWQLYGYAAAREPDKWTETVLQVPEFLRLTCLSYCEFIELWKSGYVPFGSSGGDDRDPVQRQGGFPICEPCCLDKLVITFPREQPIELGLLKLAVFIRLWLKLREHCCCGYSFNELRDICDVLELFIGGALNPDFIRQLAAFQMLRDDFRLALSDPANPPPANAADADRSQLLALWVQPPATTRGWAERQFVLGVADHAGRHHGSRRDRAFVEALTNHLDPLSRLAGFDPASPTNNWHAHPTHTLRFAEVLAKIHASPFSLEDLIYLFTVDGPAGRGSPFPLQDEADAMVRPLDLPETDPTREHDHAHTLWELRRKLLAAACTEEDLEAWTWPRIAAVLQTDFGFAAADVLSFGQHFFARVLDHSGTHVDPAAALFSSPLHAADTSLPAWNTPPGGPFQYDSGAAQLTAALPMSDAAVLRRLESGHDFTDPEQQAIQDLYFQPRALLAKFALLFTDFHEAQARMVEGHAGDERFRWFRHQFALCHARIKIIAAHLASHAAVACGGPQEHGEAVAAMMLRNLAADENFLAPTAADPTPVWENSNGAHAALIWTAPNGGALAALLALAGTGLVGEYSVAGGGVVWREPGGGLGGFDRERDRSNCPVPCVLPSLAAPLAAGQGPFVAVHNGLLQKDLSHEWLGGAQGFTVTWRGALLIDQEGHYEFTGGDWTPQGEPPNYDAATGRSWRLVLKRGPRSWTLLSHTWPGETDRRFGEETLRRGAYEITLSLTQPAPLFASADQVGPVQTGFQIKYKGPDSRHQQIEIPHDRLFQIDKSATLGAGLAPVSPGANEFLAQLYTGSLRDIRRTYQRAFKAMLFSHRLGLSALPHADAPSELGTILMEPSVFAGAGYFQPIPGARFAQQLAQFDFNYLPVRDDYVAPTNDQRTNPSPQRIQALFDWWERLFDYAVMRGAAGRHDGREVWRIFQEAAEKRPADPAYLLQQIGIAPPNWPLELRYFVTQAAPVYRLEYTDFLDERWVIRAWHADRWLGAMRRHFASGKLADIRPDLWAADDPSVVMTAETQTGNANLLAFVLAGAFDNGKPRRYEDVKRLNDGLRRRGRDALLAYLCQDNRVPLPWQAGLYATAPQELSDLLLLDVQAGLPERASRIDDAISAAQAFIRRARLGLEPGWTVTRDFAWMWDREFATFEVWQACKRRHLYKENWLEWEELGKARQVAAFRFLEDRLKGAALTCAVPGGLEWWPDESVPAHDGLQIAQAREPATLRILTAPVAPPVEGLGLIGTPERDARPSWLAAITPTPPPPAQPAGGSTATELPLWMQAAIRLGKNFVRVAAAGVPAAATPFAPHDGDGPGCVSCCQECGGEHLAGIDEYYFWLVDGEYYDSAPLPSTPPPSESNDGYQYGFQDDYYDPSQQQSAYWEDPTQLPPLLAWAPLPMVRLAWCRVHAGVFQQTRRSHLGVAVSTGQTPALVFEGRSVDSLFFSVTGGQSPQGNASSPSPGFRYDLAWDGALVMPQVAPPPNVTPFAGELPSYPYFAYVELGKPAFPLSNFAPALTVAQWLRTHCRFEAALRWYRLAYDPLTNDCTWIDCKPATPPRAAGNAPQPAVAQQQQPAAPGACCDSTDISCAEAEHRAVVLHYLETLVEWGHAMMRRRHSPEAFAQARVLFDTARMVLGSRPRAVTLAPPANPPAISAFTAATPPLNPRLLDLYGIVEDRLALIHHDLSTHRLRNGQVGRDMPYFGDAPWREGWRSNLDPCAEDEAWCHPPSPYRFTFLIQKALEYAGKVQELGAELLGAFEKGDAEYLAAMRAGHERELLTIGLAAKKDQWRDADWQIESLQKTKAVSQANLIYYTGLINAGPGGLINDEIQYESLMNSALSLHAAANVIEGIGEGLSLIPDFVVGGAGFGGSPVAISWLPLGTKLGGMFAAIARIINNEAQIQSENASLDSTEAGWIRRLAEWVHQTQILTIEIQQAERQILGAQQRRDQVLVELNAHQRQMENAAEVQNFLRDKFTSHDLYLYLQREAAALYYQTYDLALHAARQAQHAFNLERGHTTRHFLPPGTWDDLHDGLMAGERLSSALRHMEKSYFDENIREFELTKHISLRLAFPLDYLSLRNKGACEIELAEWMFDQDFPGHYMRRIRNVTLTIPCVTGPYTGVHCRLTLLNSVTRIDPRLSPPTHDCCCPQLASCCTELPGEADGYTLCPDDPRMVKIYGAREAVATSSGQNDSGMFELSFSDPRYLPFEYMGAVSRWRVELPPENNYFDPNTMTDAVLHMNYTAREGGEMLRTAGMAACRGRLPGDGWALFDVRLDFPDAWELFRRGSENRLPTRDLATRIRRKFLPYLPGNPEIYLIKFALMFETAEMAEDRCWQAEGCPCPEPQSAAFCQVGFRQRGEERELRQFTCYAAAEWPRLYTGEIDVDLHPFHRDADDCEVLFGFPTELGEILKVYLFCRYATVTVCCAEEGVLSRELWTKERL